MLTCEKGGYFIGSDGIPVSEELLKGDRNSAREKTIAYRILRAHDRSTQKGQMKIKFDKMISHDITYVGIIQSARASGLDRFPVPYALTNCHNSLCAVGGTINEDDHLFGLSAAEKYGGIYVPANQAVIHQYAREEMAECGKMILGSDSHTRYGAYGCMGVGEGGPELVKQLLGQTWDIPDPEVILVWLEGEVKHGVGPHDIALSIVGATFKNGFVKNRIMEFAGPGLKNMSSEFRMAVDVMTTEATCLSSIWETDEKVREHYRILGREDAFRELKVEAGSYYDGLLRVDLSDISPVIAMPSHPSEVYSVKEFGENSADILRETEKRTGLSLMRYLKDGFLSIQQGIIAGCSGGMYETLSTASSMLCGKDIGNGEFNLSVYPSSVPVQLRLMETGALTRLIKAGAIVKPAFCGPCFGAGDTPADGTLSMRHTTRNFPNREGSKPGENQSAGVILADGRTIAATALNHGRLTSAEDIDYDETIPEYTYDRSSYEKRVYNGFDSPRSEVALRMGPNISDWPDFDKLAENVLYRICAVIHDEVTTTDELIPSGETSSYRSNPEKLASFALSRRAPEYVPMSKQVREIARTKKTGVIPEELSEVFSAIGITDEKSIAATDFSSLIFAEKPGDGSAREQAASCQKVLGGGANIAREYATKRYRSNCINWGIMPFILPKDVPFEYEEGDHVYVPDIRKRLSNGETSFPARIITKDGRICDVILETGDLSDEEKDIILSGCLINYYKK